MRTLVALTLEMGVVFAFAAALVAVVDYFTPPARSKAWNEPLSHWVAALRSPSRALRDSALDAISYLEPTSLSMVAILSPMLDDADRELRARVSSMLIVVARTSHLHASAVQHSMANALASGRSAAARLEAATVLGKTRPDSISLGALMSATTDPDAQVRAAAVFALGDLNFPPTPQEMPALLKATHDPEPDVRAAAIEALGRIWPDHERVLQVAGAALDDSASVVREQAIHTLAAFGARAERYRSRVILASQDTLLGVRSAARQALKRMPFIPRE
jgi:HEAT repeat protein